MRPLRPKSLFNQKYLSIEIQYLDQERSVGTTISTPDRTVAQM